LRSRARDSKASLNKRVSIISIERPRRRTQNVAIMATRLGGSVLVLAAILGTACAQRVPRPPLSVHHVRRPILSVDDVPLGVYEPLWRDGGRSIALVTLERRGDELQVWAQRPTGERYVRHHLTPAGAGRFAAPEMAGAAWFVRDGDDVLLGFSACYLEGAIYRLRR